ncbi:MAG TPA: hypothetical protein GXX53_04225 [Tissierellia bacterium]|nr:hypothetical protein [Tissierellia bacterium]
MEWIKELIEKHTKDGVLDQEALIIVGIITAGATLIATSLQRVGWMRTEILLKRN